MANLLFTDHRVPRPPQM